LTGSEANVLEHEVSLLALLVRRGLATV
jgi:hypothetical protein